MIEKELRKKFVIITTVMMVAILSIVFIVYDRYTSYWMKQDLLSFVEVVSYSGLFDDKNVNDEVLIEELADESSIIGIIMNNDGEVVSCRIIGNDSIESDLTQDRIESMLYADENEYCNSDYIFTRKTLDNGNTLLIAVPFESGDNEAVMIVKILILAVSGVLILVLVSLCLSRFITDPAKRAIEREKRFIADASHELKTPLSAISINAQALEINGDSSIYVKNIISESERMNRLIDRLLTLSKLENDDLKEFEEFSLSQVVQEMLLTFESIAYEHSCQFDYEVEDGLTQYGNADEIRQLIAILLDNAIKNCDGSSPVLCTCKKTSEGNELVVKNSGAGIADDEAEHVFERFYTTDKSRNNGSFGLGLAIAKSIVERHKGTIDVVSEPLDVNGNNRRETVFKVIL